MADQLPGPLDHQQEGIRMGMTAGANDVTIDTSTDTDQPALPSPASTSQTLDTVFPLAPHASPTMSREHRSDSVHPPTVTFDIEAQTPSQPAPRSNSILTHLSAQLNEFYGTHSGCLRLLGCLLVFVGVAFSLWQALETTHH